ncbi:MAG TPA: DUF4743 domain-containing protein [Candidatus Omnitrophota bacterium]|nr:DUF4743 domain-containing protein [Candidatus Omnitrophota bacterium]
MGYLDHIRRCNAHDIGKFRPFLVERRHVGWVRHDVAARLEWFPATFRITADAVTLHPRLEESEQRSEAIDAVCEELAAEHGFPKLRGERYGVAPSWGETPLLTIDRAVVSVFGVRAYGVHVNGYVDTPDGIKLWIGHRATDKAVAPGKLDNLVAGSQPFGLSLFENLIKEAAEEADIPRAIAATAHPVGAVCYCLEDEWGLKPDAMFCYDLEVPDYFTPRNTDGEVTHFALMDVVDVAKRVRDSDDFKYNVNLVILDFLVRRGILSPEDDPEYLEIVRGLRQGW